MSDYIPKTDAQFHTWQGAFMTSFTPNATEWGVPTPMVTALTAKQTAWTEKWLTAKSPATRTSVQVQAKNEARAAYESAIRTLYKEWLAWNSLVSDDQRRSMGLPVHKTTRTPVSVPTTYPSYEIDSGTLRRLTIHFRNHGSTGKAKPDGVHGAEIRWSIGENATPLTLDQLTRSEFDTRSPFTLEFEDGQRGRTVYFCLRWENTRGGKGPWSEIASAIIP